MPKDLVSAAQPVANSLKEVRDAEYTRLKKMFTQPAIQSVIKEEAVATAEWLREDEFIINNSGGELRESWFDGAGFDSPLPNRMAEKERHHTLDAKVYEHGIPHFGNALSARGIIDFAPDDISTLVFLRSGEVKGWWRYLVGLSWCPEENHRRINLREFRDTGDFHPETPQSHAHKKLMTAARFGLAIVGANTARNGFTISAGPVGKVFFENVWFPVTEEFSSRITKWKKVAK